jgi:hypothetical protein
VGDDQGDQFSGYFRCIMNSPEKVPDLGTQDFRIIRIPTAGNDGFS